MAEPTTAPTAPATGSAPTTAGAAAPPASSTSPGAQPSTTAPADQGAEKPPFNDAFSEIDKIIEETQQKAPKPPGAKRPPATAGQPPKDQKTAEPNKGAVKPPEEQDETKLNASDLRTAYQRRKAELKEERDKRTAMEAKIKEYEAKLGDTQEMTKLQERLAQLQKRAEEQETELKFANYEKSGEYKEKYYEPFVQAYQAGRTKVASLKIQQVMDDLGEVTQQARKATAEDFDNIMAIADDGEAAELAHKMFGPMANLVMYHREKVQDLNAARINAIDDYRKKGSEREAQTSAQMKEAQKKIRGIFGDAIKEGVNKHPQWFKADDGDEQGKQLLERGLQQADMLFSESAGKMDATERAVRHAAMRNKAGAFDYVALKLHRALARIAELETENKQYQQSEPNEPGQERSEGTKAMSADEEIDLLVAKGR